MTTIQDVSQLHLPGISAAIKEVNARLQDLARDDGPVLISGEPGTEKAFAAKVLHQMSQRADGPLSKVTVSWRLPADIGDRYRMCHGGTLICNVTKEFPHDMQYTVLEMATDGTITDPQTGDHVEGDVRIVLTTSLELEALVENSSLLPELVELFRTRHVCIPPIRDRREDIPALVRYASQRAHDTKRSRARAANAQVLALFRAWHWPGNAEDLLLVTAEAAINAESDTIGLNDLPGEFMSLMPPDIVEQARQVRLPKGPVMVAPLPPPTHPIDPRDLLASALGPETGPMDEEPMYIPSMGSAPPPFEPPTALLDEEELHALTAEANAAAKAKAKDAADQAEFNINQDMSEAERKRLHRLVSLARKLNVQSQVIARQMAGPTTAQMLPTMPPESLGLAEDTVGDVLTEALEDELDKGLDAVLGLRRLLAKLNQREQETIATARDIYRRLILAGQDPETSLSDPEMSKETQKMAGSLKELEDIVAKITERFPEAGGKLQTGLADLLRGEEARSIIATIRRAKERDVEEQQRLSGEAPKPDFGTPPPVAKRPPDPEPPTPILAPEPAVPAQPTVAAAEVLAPALASNFDEMFADAEPSPDDVNIVSAGAELPPTTPLESRDYVSLPVKLVSEHGDVDTVEEDLTPARPFVLVPQDSAPDATIADPNPPTTPQLISNSPDVTLASSSEPTTPSGKKPGMSALPSTARVKPPLVVRKGKALDLEEMKKSALDEGPPVQKIERPEPPSNAGPIPQAMYIPPPSKPLESGDDIHNEATDPGFLRGQSSLADEDTDPGMNSSTSDDNSGTRPLSTGEHNTNYEKNEDGRRRVKKWFGKR